MALYDRKKGKKENNLHITSMELKNIKNLFTIHILQVLRSFYRNNDPLSKTCLKGYVLNPFLKPVEDVDLHK